MILSGWGALMARRNRVVRCAGQVVYPGRVLAIVNLEMMRHVLSLTAQSQLPRSTVGLHTGF